MSPHLPLLSLLVIHAIVAYTLAVAPVLSRRTTRRVEQEIEAGDTGARLRLYRGVLLSQGIIVLALSGLVVWGGVPAAAVGLGRPVSWPVCLALTAGAIGLLIWSGFRLRGRASSARARLRSRGNVVIPTTDRERVWFTAVGFGAGLSEELLCRGFLFFCVQYWFPATPLWALVVVTSALFGIAHLYQGIRGIVVTGVVGVLFGLAYAATGNLLLPILFHGFGNARVSFLPAESDTPLPATVAA